MAEKDPGDLGSNVKEAIEAKRRGEPHLFDDPAPLPGQLLKKQEGSWRHVEDRLQRLGQSVESKSEEFLRITRKQEGRWRHIEDRLQLLNENVESVSKQVPRQDERWRHIEDRLQRFEQSVLLLEQRIAELTKICERRQAEHCVELAERIMKLERNAPQDPPLEGYYVALKREDFDDVLGHDMAKKRAESMAKMVADETIFVMRIVESVNARTTAVWTTLNKQAKYQGYDQSPGDGYIVDGPPDQGVFDDDDIPW